MNFLSVVSRLNDLPSTFKRIGPPYTQIIDALGWQLAEYTNAADATAAQVTSFSAALDGWLDTWGLIWGVVRNANEANSSYSLRIARTVLAWVGTVPAIQAWLNFYAPGGTITENLPNVGYTITLPTNMTSTQIQLFILSLNRIRPAGVPFVVYQQIGGLFLGTEEFLGLGAVEGSYLSAGLSPVTLSIGPCTPNQTPLLPSLLFSDPTLNPSLATGG